MKKNIIASTEEYLTKTESKEERVDDRINAKKRWWKEIMEKMMEKNI